MPTGDAPTTSEWSTILLPTKVRIILETWRYILLYKLIVHSDFDQTMKLIYSDGSGTYVYPMIIGQRIGAKTCGLENVFLPDEPIFGLDTNCVHWIRN